MDSAFIGYFLFTVILIGLIAFYVNKPTLFTVCKMADCFFLWSFTGFVRRYNLATNGGLYGTYDWICFRKARALCSYKTTHITTQLTHSLPSLGRIHAASLRFA